jgi:hypothetical protein
VTGDIRKFGVAELSAKPANQVTLVTESIAVDAMLPIIPATKERKGNSMTLTGEFAWGSGISDLYTGLTGGVPISPTLPNPMMTMPPPAYTADFDQGQLSFDAAGGLHAVDWRSFNLGLQYYFPALDGRLWLSGNYSRMWSDNSGTLLGLAAAPTAALIATAKSKIRDHEDWFDVNIFGDPYPGVRLGIEYSRFIDTYVDGVHGVNDRGQFSGWFIF